ncbi:MAG: hypothetical protein LBC40_07925 [Dysgonamonadaceae bacterium]|jgi:hypothetical protein|nr:hypothetical protein [Dysgonamonadaceae bacterium]
MKYLRDFPSREEMERQAGSVPFEVLNVNGHFHTPYSFSAFTGMEQIAEMAAREGIKALGINDFYVTDGYAEFAEMASRERIFPMFNIESIALSKAQQAQGIRVNDPNNPGRTYFSGKGLDYPVTLSGRHRELLESVKSESQRQVAEMIAKLNGWLEEAGIALSFTYEEIRRKYARLLVRERHIAQALRIAVFEKESSEDRRKVLLQKIYGGKETGVNIAEAAALENELRNNLLKAGGKAFVEEDDKAFLSVEEVKSIYLNAGGIPCYPVLLDDAKGNFTEFESDKESMCRQLKEQHIYSIELIPGRNRLEVLEPFVRYFDQQGFVITFGTEHNAPGLIPLTVGCRGGAELTAYLKRVNYEGACVIAAHQYFRSRGEEGYVDAVSGEAHISRRKEMIATGNAVIRRWIGA